MLKSVRSKRSRDTRVLTKLQTLRLSDRSRPYPSENIGLWSRLWEALLAGMVQAEELLSDVQNDAVRSTEKGELGRCSIERDERGLSL